MSRQARAVETTVTVCDLCDKPIPDDLEAEERGSLTHGFLAYPVEVRTKHAYLIWPRRKRGGPHVIERHYDFHADCIGRLVASATTEAES